MNKTDPFAGIAISGISTEGKGLSMPAPPEFTPFPLPSAAADGPRTIFPSGMHTWEELRAELARRKERMAPFKARLAPAVQETRSRMYLDSFDWRVETPRDRTCFADALAGGGEWTRVTVPHYGEPLGEAATIYRTVFYQDAVPPGQRVFLHFCGVDYKAQVFVNGALAGTHEGFFAPFEFDVTPCLREGENALTVRVENDFVQKRSPSAYGGEQYGGDKLYAATGPGYDEPLMGWHHCPPGMGIYQRVWLERRGECHISGVWVRPLPQEGRAEARVQVRLCRPGFEDVRLRLSVYGRNHEQTVFEGKRITPETGRQIGLGDTYTEALLKASGTIGKPVPLYMEKGFNELKIPFDMPAFRWWSPDEPWLYELQAVLERPDGTVLDAQVRSFGMRSFSMDGEHEPRGAFYLNGEKIRLRGANTMGHEQQCVMRGDANQLEEDLLLARICNMNFLRLTQRPVQEEVYDLCDCLGVMTQTDLPLFGVLRINMFEEALRQTAEMTDLVRGHPCNIMITYINEPFPNASNQPHRQLDREGLETFFACADRVVRMHNPEQVIKQVDGDYDPPCASLPDNHCYTLWYNGCGIPAGALHKGGWLPVKEGWNYGCGEFGVEGLDPADLMRRRYPAEWLPRTPEEEADWSPSRIAGAQTGNFHYFFYETPHTLEGWAEASQRHQAEAIRLMTEAFRRSPRMVSFAVHLFIDAFPAGWMKAIMDCERRPKPAYFAYQRALSPVMASLRTDRLHLWSDERLSVEVWGCSDLNRDTPAVLRYEVSAGGRVFCRGEKAVTLPASDSVYLGSIETGLPAGVPDRVCAAVRVVGADGGELYANDLEIRVTQRPPAASHAAAAAPGGRAMELCGELGLGRESLDGARKNTVILLDSYGQYACRKEELDRRAAEGGRIVFLALPEGEYRIGDELCRVRESCMMPMNFVSRDTGHPFVEGFAPDDFKYWYDPSRDRIEPILECTFTAGGFQEILASGNTDEQGRWRRVMAAGEKPWGKGSFVLCQIRLNGLTRHNPAAALFARRLLSL